VRRALLLVLWLAACGGAAAPALEDAGADLSAAAVDAGADLSAAAVDAGADAGETSLGCKLPAGAEIRTPCPVDGTASCVCLIVGGGLACVPGCAS
jgi:hypothetical protein